MKLPSLFRSLRNPLFARLYFAQTVSLLGDALTWVGLALLAVEVAPANSAIILATALTLRIVAFVFLSPWAGAIADRSDRKQIMVVTHLVRLILVCLLTFVTQVWQIYLLTLGLNSLYAFFTPTYKATIPLIVEEEDCPRAIALSGATYQLLGVFGPGMAGGIAAWVGVRQVFFLDGVTFAIAAVLIFSLPGSLRVRHSQEEARSAGRVWQNVKEGTTRLFADPPLRYALAIQLVASIAGALILVNTVGYVKNILLLGDAEYGWVMAAFGLGATSGAVALGTLDLPYKHSQIVFIGAIALTVALLGGNAVGLPGLLVLWAIAGAGQSCINLPTQTLIAERVPKESQGRVYGAHFAWSHLWWGLSYPLAGWLGTYQTENVFFYGSCIGIALLVVVQLTISPQGHQHEHRHQALYHYHEHIHDEHHQHQHDRGGDLLDEAAHAHYHYHTAMFHSHPHSHAYSHNTHHLHGH
ncbi:MFS transporter [Lusitaniella coriacea]|uniref:MFS transporter n=1 Tax=Lusitaniella coriacea TaxID=1983105 RepID=UPI003CFA4CD1